MKKEIEIKPCPFCGSKDIRAIHQKTAFGIGENVGADVDCCIVCNECNCQTVSIKGYEYQDGTTCITSYVGKPYMFMYDGSTLDFALSVWNRRAATT